MPVEARTLSVSQFSELLGLDPKRFIGVKDIAWDKAADGLQWERKIVIYQEPDDANQGHISPTER